MSDTKILQSILDGQSSIRGDIIRLEKKVDNGFGEVKKRLDNIGLSVAKLEDDTPTIEEFDKPGKRVSKLEHQVVKN